LYERGLRMLNRLARWFGEYWMTVRVVGTFILLITVFFSMLTWGPIVDRIDFAWMLARVSAGISWMLLRVVGVVAGFPVSIAGTNLYSGDFRVDVSPACSGAVPTMIYLSAVFAYPTFWRAKLIGAGIGIGIITGANLLRVVALFLIGMFYNEYFHDTHVYVAQALVVAVAVATWVFWAGRFTDATGH
jgi:exosortase/archaeosortase family protein